MQEVQEYPPKELKKEPSSNEEVKKRYILQVPPDFSFKGDPPHWVKQLFLEPLKDGWKREVVIRATPINKKVSDVYYYAPDGKKFRSRREIGQYLLDHGIEKYSAVYNFTFNGRIFGEEFSPHEVVRQSLPVGCHTRTPKEGKPAKPAKQEQLRKAVKKKRKIVPSYSHQASENVQSGTELFPPEPQPEEEMMVFDEEIEIDSDQLAVFDPDVLSSLCEPRLPMALPVVKEKDEKMSTALPVSQKHEKMSTALPVSQKRTPTTVPKKRQVSFDKPTTIKRFSNVPSTVRPMENERRYCICDDVEHGEMVCCDNGNCEIGWYHFKCVKMQSCPPGSWFCPICRGPTSDVLNPAYGVPQESC